MLILSRKQGEAIVMDGGIRILVLSTENGGVRLGIEAPEHIGIVREEILDRDKGKDEANPSPASDAASRE